MRVHFIASLKHPRVFYTPDQDDEAKDSSRDVRKKGGSDTKNTAKEEDEGTKIEHEQSEHQAENEEEAESHAEAEESLGADGLDNQSLKDIVRANILTRH